MLVASHAGKWPSSTVRRMPNPAPSQAHDMAHASQRGRSKCLAIGVYVPAMSRKIATLSMRTRRVELVPKAAQPWHKALAPKQAMSPRP